MLSSRRGAPLLESRAPVVSVSSNSIQLHSNKGENLIDQGADAVKILARATTGSGTFVYRVRTIDKEHIVLKVARHDKRAPYDTRLQQREKKIAAGLRHEKKVYAIFTRLVTSGITPFLLMGVMLSAKMPGNVLATETAAPEDMMTLSQYFKIHSLSYMHARALIFQLVYTVEVLYRIGARHNDIHLGNVMMVRERQAAGQTMRIVYLTRDLREFEYDLPLYGWQPRIYDFDRVFKRDWKTRMHKVQTPYRKTLSPSAVTARFPWHDPKIDSSEMNVTKLLRHIRNAASRNAYSNLSLAVRNISINSDHLRGLFRKHSLNRKTWFEYYIPVDGRDREINISSDVQSSEMIILTNLGPEFPKSNSNNPFAVANMRHLYLE